jgi:hypothetical protein
MVSPEYFARGPGRRVASIEQELKAEMRPLRSRQQLEPVRT